eukprot:TRINITY_DN44379_c0_g1_i1.p1 TRINITY_DN44379_c0_g1~~TRINITY_DN44379_c0_g1_i1.p1  ORF type:complete len:656 (+),score=76.86 TRINITY_DN44379_c0_g1_i1:116-2083(+)
MVLRSLIPPRNRWPRQRCQRSPSSFFVAWGSVVSFSAPMLTNAFFTDDAEGDAFWPGLGDAIWDAVDAWSMSRTLVEQLMALQQNKPSVFFRCPDGAAAAVAALAASSLSLGVLEPDSAVWSFISPFDFGLSFFKILDRGIAPLFGAIEWLAAELPPFDELSPLGSLGDDHPTIGGGGCRDRLSQNFRLLLDHHFKNGDAVTAPVPLLAALEYGGSLSSSALSSGDDVCPVGRASALIAAALAIADGADEAARADLLREVKPLVDRAEALLRRSAAVEGFLSQRDEDSLEDATARARLFAFGGHRHGGWPVWGLLHRLARVLTHGRTPGIPSREPQPRGCLLLVYAFPTEEIRTDTAKALRDFETFYVKAHNVSHPLVVFTDADTAVTLQSDFRNVTSLPVVPAVIPQDALDTPMQSYSCIDGLICETGRDMGSSAHRGKVNGSQFWSARYLRISRYTAGPLFLHPALDRCTAFLKIDTDFFFTAPVEQDPIEVIRRDGSRLAYWQIHVQGQRQTGYMAAALEYLEENQIHVKNRAFYARGRFEERAEKLGIHVSEVPEALEASTVVYGCLFGGDVRFFRGPVYQEFFRHMDAKKGFETHGWSNQFFLGTAAASLLYPSQVRRLYISGYHQESRLDVANGTVTEFLLGSTKSVFR